VSNIKYLDIDENYPRPGVNNSSAGFRKNFKIIKDSLETARDEIIELQDNTAKVDQDNDFSGNNITNANLVFFTKGVHEGGVLSPEPNNLEVVNEIKFEDGSYQTFTIDGKTIFDLKSPIVGLRYTSIMLELKKTQVTTNWQVGFNSADSDLFYDDSFQRSGSAPNELRFIQVTSNENPTIIEIGYHESLGFLLKNIGIFEKGNNFS